MIHEDHIKLIRQGIAQSGGIWADLGSGEGAFTLALRDSAGPKVEIYSVDQNSRSLEIQKDFFDKLFPNTNIHYLNLDFTKPLPLPKLDGIIMANSIHYVKNKPLLMEKLKRYLKLSGRFIVVEYNSDRSNPWVPYPLPFTGLTRLAVETGFRKPQLFRTIPSYFMQEIYSAMLVLEGRGGLVGRRQLPV